MHHVLVEDSRSSSPRFQFPQQSFNLPRVMLEHRGRIFVEDDECSSLRYRFPSRGLSFFSDHVVEACKIVVVTALLTMEDDVVHQVAGFPD